MQALLCVFLLIYTNFFQGVKGIVGSTGPNCQCGTPASDSYKLLFGVRTLNLTSGAKTAVLQVTGDAFSFLEGENGPVFAAARYGCGKVAVVGSQEELLRRSPNVQPVMLTSILRWLSSTGGKKIGILSLHGKLRGLIAAFHADTRYTVTNVASRFDVEPYDILIAQTRTNFNNKVNRGILEAVKAGKSLLLVTRLSRNINELSQTFGITITDTLTDVNVAINPPELPDPSECITTEVDFGDFKPGEITSIADNGFVPQEGIGASYYGIGKVLVIGNQALFQRGSTFRENTDFITEALSWVQDCNNCSCEVGYMMRGTPFVRMSKYLEQMGKDVPAVEITPDEMCTTCCVGINLGVVRGDNVDAKAVQGYVYNGGCLILTCPNAATNIRPINDLLEPFGLEIPLRKD